MTWPYFKEVVQNLLRDLMYNEWRNYEVTQNDRKGWEIAFEGFWAFKKVIYISSTLFYKQNCQIFITDIVLIWLQTVSKAGAPLTCSKLFQFKRISKWHCDFSSLTESFSC